MQDMGLLIVKENKKQTEKSLTQITEYGFEPSLDMLIKDSLRKAKCAVIYTTDTDNSDEKTELPLIDFSKSKTRRNEI